MVNISPPRAYQLLLYFPTEILFHVGPDVCKIVRLMQCDVICNTLNKQK